MNLTGRLDTIDFTTLARVKEMIDPTSADASLDPLISRLIADVSSRFTSVLMMHGSKVERTEVYEVRQHTKMISLDADNVDASPFSLKYAAHPSTLSGATPPPDIAATSFVLNAPGGWLRLLFDTKSSPGYLQVIYTGGMGTDTDDLVIERNELAYACDLQVKYQLDRRDSLGGNVTSLAGGSTSFESEFRMLKEVDAILEQYRRVA